MSFDLTKQYMHMEDNEDGTITVTMNAPELLGVEEVVVAVVHGSLTETILGMTQNIDPRAYEEARKNTTFVPNNMEDM
jgi:hypothetical protein